MIIALAIMGISNGFSQKISAENKYEFGLRIAPSISWVGSDSKSLNANGISLDWNYGFTISRYINSRYAFGLELNVINTTSKINYNNVYLYKTPAVQGNVSELNMNYNLRYVQIPVLFKMRTDNINSSRFSILGEFGLGLGFLIRSKADVNSNLIKIDNLDVDNPDDNDKFDIRSDIASKNLNKSINIFNPQFIIGGGVQYDAFSKSKICVGLRYNGGLADMLMEDKWTATNSFTSLNFGFIF
jgi:hypothetical protein